ncbi:hypothetical protein J3A83DRAFT_4087105, partial [Scleroderma citrinum]
YKELNRSDLKVSTAVTDPNARGYRDDTLVWFWTMDVPWDTATENWMSEYMYNLASPSILSHAIILFYSLLCQLAQNKGPL